MLDNQLKQCISRELDSIDPVERAILRLSTYELLFRPDVPPKVVLNEAIELSRVFGSEEGFRFVNGVLDALVKRKPVVEIRQWATQISCRPGMDEFRLIERFFRRDSKSSEVVVGIGDDGAVVKIDANKQTVLVTDTLVAGVHFPERTDPQDLGYKLLAVNLSDLAAMGAMPNWFLLNLVMPDANESWLQGFSTGSVFTGERIWRRAYWR